MKKKRRSLFLLSSLISIFIILGFVSAVTGPDSVSVITNETKGANSAYELNISGGYISTINITSTTQNTRWKSFVGNITGSFTLDDSSGSTIYDWSLTNVAGEVYATTNSSTITWSNLTCASTSNLESENVKMNHTNSDDNITATFNDNTHSAFYVASVSITANSCPTLNTYVNDASQDTSFEEVALYEALGGNIIYSTILEQDTTGFDGNSYDFQMIIPENGDPGFTGLTTYYLYVELN